MIFKEDKIINKECSMNEEPLNQNNIILNSDIHQEEQAQNHLNETLLKTSSRPQRQAAIKAENQIRVNKYKLIMSINNYNILKKNLCYVNIWFEL